MRLIDADALIDDIRKNSESYFADDFAHKWVERQPTVDAVPVVMCKDCANRLVFTDGSRLCFGGICSGATHDDFFCANGIRKENEG